MYGYATENAANKTLLCIAAFQWPTRSTHRARGQAHQDRIKTEPQPRADWTTETIQYLLEVRYCTVSKNKFNTCQTNKQKTAWWEWLTARLNTSLFARFTSKQVKNKFTALKKEYRALIGAETETGNLEDTIKYPPYWEYLREAMQVFILYLSIYLLLLHLTPLTLRLNLVSLA